MEVTGCPYYTAVFSALRDDTKKGCVADYTHSHIKKSLHTISF